MPFSNSFQLLYNHTFQFSEFQPEWLFLKRNGTKWTDAVSRHDYFAAISHTKLQVQLDGFPRLVDDIFAHRRTTKSRKLVKAEIAILKLR